MMTDDNAPALGGQGQRTGDEPELSGTRPKCPHCGEVMHPITLKGGQIGALNIAVKPNSKAWVHACKNPPPMDINISPPYSLVTPGTSVSLSRTQD